MDPKISESELSTLFRTTEPSVSVDVFREVAMKNNRIVFDNEKNVSASSTSNQNIAKESFLNENKDLSSLPDIVLGKIISYLHWKEKEWLLMAYPEIERVMDSTLSWEYFENDRSYTVEKLYMYIYFPSLVEHEMNVIAKYGRYFQYCVIWLHNVSGNNGNEDTDLILLETINRYCFQLKTLRIIHPMNFSFSKLKTFRDRYLKPLYQLSKRDEYNLELIRLFYCSVDSLKSGIMDFVSQLNGCRLTDRLTCLDFSHGLLSSGKIQTLDELKSCLNLRILKCPIHTLNSNTLESLVNNSLRELYTVNNEHTKALNFVEDVFIDWSEIFSNVSPKKRECFRVHYIFKNRPLLESEFAINPFVSTLVFENLSVNITAEFLSQIGELYGKTLINLAFCSNYWEFLMHFTDLSVIDYSFKNLAGKCLKLSSFLSCLTIPSTAVLNLVNNSKSLKALKLYRESIRISNNHESINTFTEHISRVIQQPDWQLISKGENIFQLPDVDNKLLFANCILKF